MTQARAEQNVLWTPHPRQELFLRNPAYECLFGGAAGGGKTDALLFGGLRYVHVKGYAALMLRRSFPELKEVMDRAFEVFPSVGGHWHGDDKRWIFPSGATFEMGYLERYEDVMRYQGRQFAYIAFDEIGQCVEERTWTKLMAWNRTPIAGIQKFMRCSANPGGPGHAWLRRRFISKCSGDGTAYIDPRTGFSRAFVASTVKDNPTIMENDPSYIRQLELLPETLRLQLLEGDWEAGTGMALEELEERVHLVKPFDIPGHWVQFGAFDWGYRHPFSFGHYAANEDGDVFKIATVTGMGMLPGEIARTIRESVPVDQLRYVVAGHDVFDVRIAHGETTKPISEIFGDHGIMLQHANTDRKHGLQQFREYVAWRGYGGDGRDVEPRLRLFDNPGNRACFNQLEDMVMDEKRPEDTMKRNADEQGENGDDMYDETRYAIVSHHERAEDVVDPTASAWDTAALKHERDQKLRGNFPGIEADGDLLSDEFGDLF
jgi:hypothetical protein